MTLVDSNVLRDIFSGAEPWLAWSKQQLELRSATRSGFYQRRDLCGNFGAVQGGRISRCCFERDLIDIVPTPRPALFLAGKTFRQYRTAGGLRTGVLSDFFIGAHAATLEIPLLTRDVRRYRHYFPMVELITPTSP